MANKGKRVRRKAAVVPAAAQALAPHAPAPQAQAYNGEWYVDDMVNAVLGTTVPGANFRHRTKTAAGVTEHVFITPTVTGTRRDGIREDVVLDYYVNKEKQIGAHRVDIFDELSLFRNENEDVRILIPYCTGDHWMTCEVKIQKRGGNVNADVQLHDPYGRGRLDQAIFRNLQESITRRIVSKFPDLNVGYVTCSPSRFNFARQAANDGNSCGVIICKEISELADTGTIVRRAPYSEAEIQVIRDMHLEDLGRQGGRQGLIDQYSGGGDHIFDQVMKTIGSLQLELDEKKRLEKQRFLMDNLGKLKKMDGVVTGSLFRGVVLVFHNSTRNESFHIVANGKNFDIQCKDAKGKYIVELQRVDADGNLVPGCMDVLSYNDGKLQNAVTIGDVGQSSSRVQGLLDQVNKRGATVSQISPQQPAPAAAPVKSWVDYVIRRRAEEIAAPVQAP